MEVGIWKKPKDKNILKSDVCVYNYLRNFLSFWGIKRGNGTMGSNASWWWQCNVFYDMTMANDKSENSNKSPLSSVLWCCWWLLAKAEWASIVSVIHCRHLSQVFLNSKESSISSFAYASPLLNKEDSKRKWKRVPFQFRLVQWLKLLVCREIHVGSFVSSCVSICAYKYVGKKCDWLTLTTI